MIKAIETQYKGYRFRSRLEARWAVFFDLMGIPYAYEEEGFERQYSELGFDVPEDNIEEAEQHGSVYKDRYLPDFRLGKPGSGLYAEVKGDNTELTSNSAELTELHDFGGILPGFCDSLGTNRGLLLLGEIPLPNQCLVLHPIMQHRKGIWKSFAAFSWHRWESVKVISDCPLADLMNCEPESDPIWDSTPKLLQMKSYYINVDSAYIQARSARFEHGESGPLNLSCRIASPKEQEQ